ncbi:MAG: hypothetical protein ACT4PE_08700 [Candidatus Eiseniibacteriota bacterium]
MKRRTTAPLHGRTGRVLHAAGILIALGFLLWTVRSAWVELSENSVSVALPNVLVSLGMLCIGYLGFVALWREVLATLGARVKYIPTLQLWTLSNLGRYLPGKIWAIAGVAAAARAVGISPGLGATGAVLALALSIGTGALVSVVLLPEILGQLGATVLLLVALTGAVLGPVAAPGLLARALRVLPASWGCSELPPIGRLRMLRLGALFCGGWAVHGVAFSVFASAFGPVLWHQAAKLTGIYALAYVAGLLAFFAPGGIGVREGVLSKLLLLGGFDALPVNTLSVATRLWAISAELLVLVAALVSRLRARVVT